MASSAYVQSAPAKNLRQYIVNVPDFPKPGILFRDIAPLLRTHFADTVDQVSQLFTPEEWARADHVAGIESRGFILAAALAGRHGKGFIPIRKAGKLPGHTAKVKYGLEYGEAEIEMHYGDGAVIIVDDVLATGGTLGAAADLVSSTGHGIVAMGVLINLAHINDFSWRGQRARSVLTYHE